MLTYVMQWQSNSSCWVSRRLSGKSCWFSFSQLWSPPAWDPVDKDMKFIVQDIEFRLRNAGGMVIRQRVKSDADRKTAVF